VWRRLLDDPPQEILKVLIKWWEILREWRGWGIPSHRENKAICQFKTFSVTLRTPAADLERGREVMNLRLIV
jgi:hypothetical protein